MKNRTKIKIKGLNQEKIINNIAKNLKIYNLKREENNCSEFEIDLKNKKKISTILSQNNIEILQTSDKGLLYNLRKIFTSVGILCGIILTSIVYFIQYFFVWKIEVFGIENNEEIAIFIEENIPSKLKSNINTKNIEISVKEHFEHVSSISAAIVGQSLIININEAVLPEEMEDSFSPLISQENGLITQINLIQGTLNCKVGDIVQKGDVLVLPYMIDSQGEKRDVKPKADIYADIWLSVTTTHYDYYLKTERTGRSLTHSQVILGDKVIYEHKKELKFSQYESEKSEHWLNNNLILPLKIKKIVYFETETFEVCEPFDDVKEQIIANTRSKALQFLKKNDIIKEEGERIKEAQGCYNVTYTITVTRNIGG